MSNPPSTPRETLQVDRVVQCPDCYRLCEWCSWYAMNARAVGCGTLFYKKKCKWGESLKGTTCPTCGGTERMRLRGELEPTI
jgi:hypothetical protein